MRIWYEFRRNILTAMLLAIGTVLTTGTSFSLSMPKLMPFLGAAVIYPLYLLLIARRCYNQAMLWVLWWAICQSLAVAGATVLAPERATEVVLNGAIYTEDMFHWIRTGEGSEGSLQLFLPLHLREYALFSLLSLVTLGSAALILGTYLLNYMNFYVGQLVYQSSNPWLAALVGWPPWSILRVVGYIATGLALTALALNLGHYFSRKFPQLDEVQAGEWFSPGLSRRSTLKFPHQYFLVGLGFLLGDLLVKATLAPIWQQLLQIALIGTLK
ncbi:MAG: hypothetical protein QNJ18_04365 [Xenococcaceae cyanobacterium MO_167.B52]|nr:hypothetical protein [Xenococcaceae cyanobacterium MO_167.B52]